MLKRIASCSLLVAIVALMVSCGGSDDAGSAEDFLEQVNEKLAATDVEAEDLEAAEAAAPDVCELMVDPEQYEAEWQAPCPEAVALNISSSNADYGSPEVLEVSESDGRAEATVVYPMDSPSPSEGVTTLTFTYDLEQVDGEWRLADPVPNSTS